MKVPAPGHRELPGPSRHAIVVSEGRSLAAEAKQNAAAFRRWWKVRSAAWAAASIVPLVERFPYPSAVALRTRTAIGADGLFLEVLREQHELETGQALSSELPLTELARARAELLPRALSRRAPRLLVEQHLIAPLHVRLVAGDHRIATWVRDHSRWFLRALVGWMLAFVTRRRYRLRDPVERFRVNPDAFSAFVWRNLWAIPELSDTLESVVPPTRERRIDGASADDPGITALRVATRLETDHAGWADPVRLLRELHTDIRAANTLAPEHPLVGHVLARVNHAVRRLPEFESVYERATAEELPPDWLGQALDAADAVFEQYGTESATKLVRRISCRLWVTGGYQATPAERPATVAREPAGPGSAADTSPACGDEEDETGF